MWQQQRSTLRRGLSWTLKGEREGERDGGRDGGRERWREREREREMEGERDREREIERKKGNDEDKCKKESAVEIKSSGQHKWASIR
jgi:hypothetical protein